MENFPKQWPGSQYDMQGPRYVQWSQEMPPSDDTPFDSALQSARQPYECDAQANVSAYTVSDFNSIPQIAYDLNKHDFNYRSDELGRRFLTPVNAFAIHREISKAIFDLYHIWIPKQEDLQFAQVLNNAYRSFFNINHRTGDVDRDLYNLNVMVIDAALPNMLANVRLKQNQLAMIDRVPTPNPRPVNVNNTGLDGRSNLDITRFLPLAEYFEHYDPRSTPYVPGRDYFENLRGTTLYGSYRP